MCNKIKTILLVLVLAIIGCQSAYGFSLALDSVATWGKFPKFCIDIYRWGDRTFNSYDSTYVEGTGHKFNVKFKTESWVDHYSFFFGDNLQMNMRSQPSTSMGVWLTYLAVSVGYEKNVSKFFGGNELARKQFNFQFNCSLFAFDYYSQSNEGGMKITEFGPRRNKRDVNYEYNGVSSKSWGIDTYHFFNNKKYSQGAAFNYSKIQRKSAGTFYAGISIWIQEFNFDFSSLPLDIRQNLPTRWQENGYKVNNNNYAIKLGYAYNWVFTRRWLLGFTIAPTIGFRYSNADDFNESKYNFSLYNRTKLSVIYNSKHWFAGLIGKHELGLINEKEHSLVNMTMSFEAAVGFRFNLW